MTSNATHSKAAEFLDVKANATELAALPCPADDPNERRAWLSQIDAEFAATERRVVSARALRRALRRNEVIGNNSGNSGAWFSTLELLAARAGPGATSEGAPAAGEDGRKDNLTIELLVPLLIHHSRAPSEVLGIADATPGLQSFMRARGRDPEAPRDSTGGPRRFRAHRRRPDEDVRA